MDRSAGQERESGGQVFRRVLVGFDGSTDAGEALRCAIAMASVAQGEVVVLVVVSGSRGETDEDRHAAFETEAGRLRAEAEHELRTWNGDSRLHVVADDRPARALSSYAEEHGFDVIVIGRHGRDRAAHGGLGRVARELAEKSRSCVLLAGDGGPEAD